MDRVSSHTKALIGARALRCAVFEFVFGSGLLVQGLVLEVPGYFGWDGEAFGPKKYHG